MSNLALYRKYRPDTFEKVSGQFSIVQTLKNQVTANRIAHAYLFCGLKGSGKTSIARILAKAVNCENPINGSPCCKCENCLKENNPDVIEIDAASNNGVEDARDLINEVAYKPIDSKYKIYIIDEVHMLTTSAFNALLKTLEEPPEHVIFILATTEFTKVPDTIKSRCQIFTFGRISEDDIVDNLKNILSKENIGYFDNEDLYFIAEKADGSMRDAISILDQCITCHGIAENVMSQPPLVTVEELREMFGEVDIWTIEKLSKCIESTDIIGGLDIIHKIYNEGRSLKALLDGLYKYYFKKYISDFGTTESIIYERYIRILGETSVSIEHSNQKLTITELAFIKMCKPEMEKDYNSVVQRLDILEKRLGNTTINNITNTDNVAIVNKEFDKDGIVYYNSICSKPLIIGG